MKARIFSVMLAAALICTSCGSRPDAPEGGLQARPGGESAVLQPVEQSGWLDAQLPGLSELPGAQRSPSDASDYLRTGAQIASPDSRSHAIVFGDSLLMAPDWDPAAVPPADELSWGIYAWHLPGFDKQPELSIDWTTKPPLADYYVAITDFGSNRWRWFRGDELDRYDFGSLDGYFSDFNTIYCCVLLTGKGSYELNRLRLGGNIDPVASFTVNQDTGQYNFTAGFDGSASSDPDGSIAEYHWSFEDPVYFYPGDLGPTPNWKYDHVGSFTCTLRVVDNEGGTGEATHVMTVTGEPMNLPPTAVIVPTKTGGPLPQGIGFDPFGSSDPDDIIFAYRWDLDDDGFYEYQSPIPSAYREFTKAGTFTVGLMVIDFYGAWGTDTVDITITPISGENPPTAVISVDYYCLSGGLNRIIDTSACTDPDNDIVKYEWDFEGDGFFEYDNGLYSGGDVTYTLPGEFMPTLRITDSGGRQSTASLDVIVTNGVDPQEAEPNDTPAQANSLGGLLNYAKHIRSWRGEAGGSDADDWYLINAGRETDASFWVDFNSLDVDLGIALYSDGDFEFPLVQSNLGGDREYIHWHLPGEDNYYLRVHVPEGAVQTGPGGYSLTCLENIAPVADLTAPFTFNLVPFWVTLDAAGSTDADGVIVSYDYDLDGDGIFETTGQASTYQVYITNAGEYTFGVRVTDDLGEVSTDTITITAVVV